MGIRSKKAPKVIRDLWNEIKNDHPELYPEQFDVTFDFVPRMCEKKLCEACPFGKNGAELICIPDKDKYCPVALISCGYVFKCVGNQGDCTIKENIGKNTCKGALENINDFLVVRGKNP